MYIEKKKIHFHSDCDFFAGCENMIANFLTSGELKQEFELSFTCPNSTMYQDGFSRRVNPDGIDVHPVWIPRMPNFSYRRDGWTGFMSRILKFAFRVTLTPPILIFLIVRLFVIFRRKNVDLLHINNGGYPAALSARAAAIAGKIARVPKIIMVVNNMATGYERISRKLERPLDLLVFRCVDKFITGSVTATLRLSSTFKIDNNSVQSIHNGITRRQTTETTTLTKKRYKVFGDPIIFGVVAVLEPRKGHQVLIDATEKLLNEKDKDKDKDKEFVVLIEGTGVLERELKQIVKARGLEDVIHFVGNEPHIANFFQVCDVIVLPSIANEDFPNVVIESMSYATPVIGSRLAGIPEQIIDGVTGTLVSVGNSNDLKNSMLTLLNSKKLRQKFGEEAVRVYESKFNAKVAVKNYIKLYNDLIEKNN